jgi:hypothetical protein
MEREKGREGRKMKRDKGRQRSEFKAQQEGTRRNVLAKEAEALFLVCCVVQLD